jgi:23S rRNA A2030 N6-methylase RlmJ
MIANDQELQAVLERIRWFVDQLMQQRNAESDPAKYRSSATGFLAELARMQHVLAYLERHPTEVESIRRPLSPEEQARALAALGEPRDEWERGLRSAAIDCGVSLPAWALTRDAMYDL